MGGHAYFLRQYQLVIRPASIFYNTARKQNPDLCRALCFCNISSHSGFGAV
jgi:hypothetical protein